MAIEIVDFPWFSHEKCMVDLSIAKCKRSPEGNWDFKKVMTLSLTETTGETISGETQTGHFWPFNWSSPVWRSDGLKWFFKWLLLVYHAKIKSDWFSRENPQEKKTVFTIKYINIGFSCIFSHLWKKAGGFRSGFCSGGTCDSAKMTAKIDPCLADWFPTTFKACQPHTRRKLFFLLFYARQAFTYSLIFFIWVNDHISLTWILRPAMGMIPHI